MTLFFELPVQDVNRGASAARAAAICRFNVVAKATTHKDLAGTPAQISYG